MSALWTPSTVSYMAMVSSTETTASTSATGVTPPSYLPPGMPALEAMDTLPAPTTENLLATAGVGRGSRTQADPRIPAALGLRQMRPKMPQQQAPTPGRQEVMPYRQLVFPPRRAAPKPSATPSASQDHEEPAREEEGTRGRSSSQGFQDRQRRNRSDPPSEDPGNAGGVPPATVSWTRWPTMWPQGGSDTSPTSSAAVGWPR